MNIIEIRDPCYSKLFVEFLTSFFMDKKGIDYARLGMIKFRLCGKDFSLSKFEFSMALGIYSATYVETELYHNSLSHGSSSCAHTFWSSHVRLEF